ncbi:hypothetical protein JCM6882_002930 [Rhodosporidiobolus microsporus]
MLSSGDALVERQLVQVASDNSSVGATEASAFAIQPDLSVLNALPMSFDRAGFDNATVYEVTLPESPSVEYKGQPSVEQAQAELDKLANATVVAYQPEFLELAQNITLERIFTGGNFHEAPIYIPGKNQLFLTPNNGTSQLLIDLNTTTLHNFTAVPPVENVNGGTWHDGKLYVSTNGGNETNPAVFTIDPQTNQSSIVFDNYYGLRFNSLNDLVADKGGNLWVTDAGYGYWNGFNTKPPQLHNGVYLYNATTKLVKAVADEISEPNGLILSRNESVLYIANSGALKAERDGAQAGPRVIPAGIPDGLKVDTAGRIWSEYGYATTSAVEVINPDGQLLGLIQLPTGAKATNLLFVPSTDEGAAGDDLWIVGGDSIWRLAVTGVRTE